VAGEAPKSEKKRRFDHSSDLGGLEASVEDLISSVCDSESKEGAWMSDYDIVKRGTALKLESQVGGDTVGGHCRRECRTECRKLAPDGHHHLLAPAPKAPAVAVCGAEGARRRRSPKALAVAALQRHQSGPSAPSLATALRCRTIEKACAGVVDGIDELAEYLLTAAREGKSVGTVAQRVCTKMAGVCKKGKTPAWPDSMVKVTPWQRASSAPAPPQGTRKRPCHWTLSQCLASDAVLASASG